MTNQHFTIPRFSDFIYKYLTENRKQLLLFVVSIVLFPIVMCSLIPYINSSIYTGGYYGRDPMWSVEMTLFNIYIPIMGFAVAAYMYSSLADKNRRIAILMSPASNLEKFVTFFLIYILAANVIIIGSTFIADWMRVLIVPLYNPDANVEPISLQTILSMGFNIIPDDSIHFNGSNPTKSMEAFRWSGYFLFSVWFSCFAIGQAFFALGSSVWPKNSFLKTALTGLVIIIVGSILFGTGLDYFSEIFYHDGIRRMRINQLNKETLMGTTWSVTVIVTVFTYWLSYFRFKEIETINRW